MTGNVFKVEEISGPRLDAFDRDSTIIVIPFGILELHGPHLPYGTDLFETEAMTEKIIQTLLEKEPTVDIALFPTIPLGVFGIENLSPSMFTTYGSFAIGVETMQAIVIDMIANFAKFGFKHIVVASFHGAPEHCTAINQGADEVAQTHSVSVLPVMSYLFFPLFFGGEYIEKFNDCLKTKLSEGEKEALRRFVHAEAVETSAMLNLKPKLVDDSYKTLKPVVFEYEKMFEEIRKLDNWQGYVGIPSEARAEIGQVFIDVVGKECASLILKWYKGNDLGGMRRYPEGLNV